MSEGAIVLVTETRVYPRRGNACKLAPEKFVIGVVEAVEEIGQKKKQRDSNGTQPHGRRYLPGKTVFKVGLSLDIAVYSKVRDLGAAGESVLLDRSQGIRLLEASIVEPALISRTETLLQSGLARPLFLRKVYSLGHPFRFLRTSLGAKKLPEAPFVLEVLTGEKMSEQAFWRAMEGDDSLTGIGKEVSYDFVKIASELVFQLNPSQLKAVSSSITKDANKRVHLLIGPPGTGKTHTIASMLACLTVHRQFTLCTACSNQAVGEIARKV
ncbi:hypothetical protein CSUI_001906, partial [Cystoisospora suis]